MYDYGEEYKSLCEAKCRRYKAYLDIYKKSTDSSGNDIYTYSKTIQSYGAADSIVSIKIVRGQTTGSFSFGNSYSGEMTIVTTASTEIGKSGDKIIPSVSFIDDEGNETEKAPLGMFFISTITQNDYTKTVKCLDGITLLDKYYTHLSYDAVGVIITYLAGLLGTTLANDVDDLPNNIRIFGTFKGYDSDGNVINYTRREICNIIASINASNAIFNAQGKLYLTIPDFTTKHVIPSSSVISYTDLNTKNKFTSIYFSDGKESSLPPQIDPQSSEYDPNVMIVRCPVRTYATKEEIEDNIEAIVKGVSYDGVTIKKQGTGLYEIGDVLTFMDTARNKSYNNIFVMGITYEISARNGFTETIYSLAKSETQQQTQGLSLNSQVNEVVSKTQSDTEIIRFKRGEVEYGAVGIHEVDGEASITVSMTNAAASLALLDENGEKILEYVPSKVDKSKPHLTEDGLWFIPVKSKNIPSLDGIYAQCPFSLPSGILYEVFANINEMASNFPQLETLRDCTLFADSDEAVNYYKQLGFKRVYNFQAFENDELEIAGVKCDYFTIRVNQRYGNYGMANWFIASNSNNSYDDYAFRSGGSVLCASGTALYYGKYYAFFWEVPLPKEDSYYNYEVNNLSLRAMYKSSNPTEIVGFSVSSNMVTGSNRTTRTGYTYETLWGEYFNPSTDPSKIRVYPNLVLMNGSKIYNEDGTEYPSNT